MAYRPDGTQRAWRIARDIHIALDGQGAFEQGGRWNSPGRRVVYAGESFAIALLERFAHLPTGRIPRNQVFVEITIPAGVASEELALADAPAGWADDDLVASRAYGDAWYDARRSAVLLVPSVVTRIEQNLLLNPTHPAFAAITTGSPAPVQWDPRLSRRELPGS
jgi:RES domain-containing protein